MTETEKKVREFCNENKLVFSTVGEGILALLAAEREACAQVAEDMDGKLGVFAHDAITIANAIRARKEK